MRRLLSALFLAAALWLVPATSSAAVIQNANMPLNQTVFNPCSGDLFVASGTIHVVAAETADASGGFHFHLDVNVSDVTGVGSVTGATYHGVGGFWTEFNADPPFPFVATATNVFGLISHRVVAQSRGHVHHAYHRQLGRVDRLERVSHQRRL